MTAESFARMLEIGVEMTSGENLISIEGERGARAAPLVGGLGSDFRSYWMERYCVLILSIRYSKELALMTLENWRL